MEISPKEFEKYVKDWFDGLGFQLKNYNSKLNNKIDSFDGTYEIDIDITYEALGVEIHVLIECKKYSSNIKRELVQILHQKIQSIGAHKGILCSTSNFQKGALQYAKKHGIACIKVMPGQMVVKTRAADTQKVSNEYLKAFGIPKVCGYIQEITDNVVRSSLVDKKHLEFIEHILKP